MKYLPLHGIALLASALSPVLTHTLGAQTAAVPDPQFQIPRTPSPDALPDPADLVPWPVKAYPEFAPNSVVNAGSWLLDAPAGKHGHVRALPSGQLEFSDGTPTRFWGTTTVFALTFPEKPEEIAKLADAIAASGYNLVRFHHNDMNRNGMGFLQEKPKSNWKLDPQGMDRLDRFAAELYKRGIYMYVDIVDYRTILEEDGLEDWQELAKLDNMGWKGLFPHPKIVEAWKRSIAELLQHKNPYTGRTWGEEPGVVTVEIINENGLYWDWNFKLSPGMLKWHDQQWNQWLVNRYKTREKLDAAWTDIEGRKGLFPDEDPAQGTVFAPRHGNILEWDRPYRSKTRGAARLNDWYLHLGESSTAFYKEAAAHIRKQGFKGVILGSHELQGPGNQFAEVQGTGAIGAHLYATGMPAWNARPGTRGAVIEGVDVKANNWFTNIPRIKVKGAPGINGEWTGGTLNRRADVNLTVAAITGFQGVTQSLHFSFGHRWIGEPMPNYDYSYKFQQHTGRVGFTFSSIHDVPWMAVNRVCAPLFTRGDFAKAKAKVHLAYSRVDVLEQNLHALGRSGGAGTVGDAGHFLPILHEVECVFFDEVYEGDADVVFMTGRSASGDYRKARRAVLVGDNPFSDPYHKTRDLGLHAKTVHPGVKVVNLETPTQFTVTWPWTAERALDFAKLEGAIELASIPAGAQAIGKSADGKYTLGWVDDRYLVLPNGRAFGERIADNQWLYRLYLAACQRWKIDTAGNAAGAAFYQSDTRELTVDWAHGTTVVDTARTQGFSGLMGWRPENTTRNLKAKIEMPYGNVLLTSTDGKALGDSRRMLLVATGRSQNTGAELGKNKEGQLSFTNTGKAPILVEALRGEVTITSSLAAKLKVFALDSTGRRLGPVETRVENGALS